MFAIRAGTQDEMVVDEVLNQNEYDLPDKLSGTVIDVGANIGAFAMACLERGADLVVCFEPCPDAYRLLKKNTAAFGKHCVIHSLPVWRSDTGDERVSFHSGGKNTACGVVSPDPGGMATYGLDAIIGRYVPVRLLKIDAEGSEYPILFTATRLHRVEEIVGELHQIVRPDPPAIIGGVSSDKFTVPALVRHLEDQGFVVTTQPQSELQPINTLFWARRPAKHDDRGRRD